MIVRTSSAAAMRKPTKGDFPPGRLRFIRVLLGVVGLCFVFMTLEAPNLFRPKLVPYNNPRPALEALVGGAAAGSLQQLASPDLNSRRHLGVVDPVQQQNRDEKQPRKESSNKRFTNEAEGSSSAESRTTTIRASPAVSTKEQKNASHELQQAADVAWAAGGEMQKLVDSNWSSRNRTALARKKRLAAAEQQQQCPQVLLLTGEQLKQSKQVMVLPCGLASGSSITLVARPLKAHLQFMPHISMVSDGQQEMMVSQFMVELRGLKLVDAEDPPRILHVNPRLKGDWSGNPVIELNTCYRGQWGVAQRCEGWISSEEELVDGLPKCQNWLTEEGSSGSSSSSSSSSDEKSKSWWLNRWINRPDKGATDWQYPFMEGRLFVLTIRAGWEGYHVSVDGRHITSFPYRTGFILEEATGFTVGGDIDVKSVVATSLPSSHSSLASEEVLEESEKYKAPPLPQGQVHLFIGILSASTHFAERMAVRKSWLQSKSILSSKVVARFFVGLHVDVEINLQVKEEAEYFGDMVVLPFIDHYDLVVLKTIAICEYAVRNISAKHIMKTDDDTFVRVETMVNLLKITRKAPGLYMGNINQFHRPLREGKWAVTYEEWPEEEYPPYANGPGYIISSDIAKFILEQRQNHTLRLFKMEDVSMGMWVVQFNLGQAVHYVHNLKFCQWGCVEEYYTAHYQSPRQMLCMWEKLQQGEAQCCNMR